MVVAAQDVDEGLCFDELVGEQGMDLLSGEARVLAADGPRSFLPEAGL